MNDKTHHTSISGRVVKCDATEQPCPRGSGAHFTQAEYDHMVATQDPRIILTGKNLPVYYTRLVAELDVVAAQLTRTAEASRKLAEYERERGAGLYRGGELFQADAATKQLKDALYAPLKRLYQEAGVAGAKAHFLALDSIEKGEEPLERRASRDDKNLLAKTRAAKKAAEEDAEYQEAVATLTNHREKLRRSRAFVRDYQDKEVQLLAQHKLVSLYEAGKREAALRAEISDARKRVAANVPDNTVDVNTKTITVNQISTKDGYINNVWSRDEEGNYERVVGYRRTDRPLEGSGEFVTESGKGVSSSSHHHSYRTDSSNVQLVIAPTNGDDFSPKEGFRVHTVYDTGG